MWLERVAATALFAGRTYTYEAPETPGMRCGFCRKGVVWLRFTGEAPVLFCDEHGMWLEPVDRVLLPEWLQTKLRRREMLGALLSYLGETLESSGSSGSSDSSDASYSDSDAGSGSEASCGGGGEASCASCGSSGGSD